MQPLPLPEKRSSANLDLTDLPTLEELESMSTDDLDELLGLKPKFDIPCRATVDGTGRILEREGGLPAASLARQPAALVRAVLAGTTRPMVLALGHILLRRALASRLATPEGMMRSSLRPCVRGRSMRWANMLWRARGAGYRYGELFPRAHQCGD